MLADENEKEGTTKDWDEKDHYKEAFELIMSRMCINLDGLKKKDTKINASEL